MNAELPGPSPLLRKVVVPLLIIMAGSGISFALMATPPKLDAKPPEAVAPAVRVLTVQPRSVQMTVASQGAIAPRTESELVPEVSGRVVWASDALAAGGRFKTGDTLLRLDDADFRASLERAKAALARAEAEHEHQSFEYQRFKQLEVSRLASRSQTENALRAARVAEANMRDAKIAVEQAERDLSRTSLAAPFSGLVRNEKVDVGQYINRGTAIATIYASDAVEVRLPVADVELAYLQLPTNQRGALEGAAAPDVKLVADFGGQRLEWHGKIVRTEAEIDSKTRLVNLVAQVTNRADQPPLTVGLFVQAEILGRTADDVVVLPRTALRNGNQVLVVDENNQLRLREVELLRLHQDEVLIRSGLKSGERVCISAIKTVIDGMPVKPIQDDSPATQAAPDSRS